MNIQLRAYRHHDFDFARQLYFETMRERTEELLGWDQVRQEASFAKWFKPDEVRIVIADGVDVGWLQHRSESDAIFLGSIYIIPAMQGKGIATQLIRDLLDLAGRQHQAVTLAVMKNNPAAALYKRLGFHVTHEDKYKLYMRWDCQA